MTANERPYILLDRDGTIIHDRHYLHDPEEMELLPNAAAGLKRLADRGHGLVVLTNQSGVGRGYFTRGDVEACNERLRAMLAKHGIFLDAVLYCPHAPEDACHCRKPATGLVEQAVAMLEFDPEKAWMIGDKDADVDLGIAVGARSILVRTGKGTVHEGRCGIRADYVADDLLEAARFIERNS